MTCISASDLTLPRYPSRRPQWLHDGSQTVRQCIYNGAKLLATHKRPTSLCKPHISLFQLGALISRSLVSENRRILWSRSSSVTSAHAMCWATRIFAQNTSLKEHVRVKSEGRQSFLRTIARSIFFDAISFNQGVIIFQPQQCFGPAVRGTMLIDKKQYQTRPSPTLNKDTAVYS